jgi:competence protein ComEC
MTVVQAVICALAVMAAAWWAAPIPLFVGLAVMALGTWRRYWWAVAFGVALVASGLGARAQPAVPTARAVDEMAVVRGDPVAFGAGSAVTMRLGSINVRATAWGSMARRLARVSGGHRVRVVGTLRPLRPDRRRGAITSELNVTAITDLGDASLLDRSANRVRQLLARSAEPVPSDVRGLYLGIGYGDDRTLPNDTAIAMRTAGLSHLTAVSGQNLAVIVGLVRPLLGRWSPRRRALVVMAVAGWLCVITRFEPSVLRAAFMAASVAAADVMARPIEPLRALACAVIVAVLLDPLLVEAPGFQLSVAATAGVVGLAPMLAARMGSDRGWRAALAITLSAQLATWPLLARYGARMALSSIPANLIAVPVAGAVMVWVWTVGVIAGFVAPVRPVASLVPTMALRLITTVADVAARHPVMIITWPMVLFVALCVVARRCWPAAPVARAASDS